MRTGILTVAAAVVVAAGGAAYYGLAVYPEQRLRAGVDQFLAKLPPGATVTYKEARYSFLSRQASLAGVALHWVTTGDKPQTIDVTVDSVETSNPNLDFSPVWAKALADPASRTPDAALPVADSIVAKGINVHSDATSGAVGSIKIDKARLYPWALLHDGLPTWAELQASMVPRPNPLQFPDLVPLMRAEAAVVLGVGYDGYVIDNMKFTAKMPATAAVPAMEAAYTIRKASAGALDRGVMKEGTIEGVTVQAGIVGSFTLDRVTMADFDAREPLGRIIGGEALSLSMLDKVKLGRIEYAGMSGQMPNQPQPIQIGSFSMSRIAFSQGMPISGAVAWTGFHLSQAQIPDARGKDAFNKLGLDAVTISFAAAYDWDLDQKRVSLHDTMFKVDELGTLTLSADISDVIPGLGAQNQARLAHAKLRFDDASLVDRALRSSAAQTGADPTAMRQQIVMMAQMQSAALCAGSPEITAAGKAIGDFISSPHELTIELSPPAPLAIATIQAAVAVPAKLAGLLGLAVTANQP